MFKPAIIALTAALALAPASAIAACKQKDLKSDWATYFSGHNGSTAYWVTCYMRVDRTGKITKSNCLTSDGVQKKIKSGKVKLLDKSLCSFNGSFKFAGKNNIFDHGTLAQDKITADAVGHFKGGTFTFSMSKV